MGSARRRAAWSHRLALVALLSALCGCAGIMDPYPEADALKNYRMADQPTGTDKLAGRLPGAIDAATAQGQAYTQAARNQSVARNVGALALVGGAATALYLGITSDSGGNRDAITAIGIAGASLLGLDQFFLSKPRQALYFKGAAAIDCSIVSMRPYLMTESELSKLKDNLVKLTTAIGQADAAAVYARASMEQLEKVAPGDSAIARAQAALTLATGERAKADGLRKAAADLKSGVESADITLISHVRQIVSQVAIEIQKTEPDLASIQPALLGLPNLARGVVPGGHYELRDPPIRLQSRNKELFDELNGNLEKLKSATQKMIEVAALVEPPVSTYQSLRAVVQSDISNCKAPTAVLSFSVTPNVTELSVTAGQSYDFAVQSAVGMPRAGFAGLSPKGSRVDILLVNGIYVVRVTIGAEASGNATLILGDGGDPARHSVALNIAAAAGGGKPPPPPPPATVSLPTKEDASLKGLAKLQMMTLQSALISGKHVTSLCVDGVDGPATRAAILKYRTAEKLTADQISWDKITATLTASAKSAADLVKEGQGATKAVTEAEKQLAGDDIKDLQGKLDPSGKTVGASGSFDQPTREALIAIQKQEDVPQTGTVLHGSIFDFLAGRKPAECK